MNKYSGKSVDLGCLLVIWFILGIIAVQNANCSKKGNSNSASSSSGKETPSQETKSFQKIELKETQDSIYARQLYNDYNSKIDTSNMRLVVDETEFLCTSMDYGKTTRIWGEAVCRQIVKKLYKNKEFKFQVYCVKLYVSFSQTDPNKGGKWRHAVVARDGSSYHDMVQCGTMEDSYVNINHLRENFYYVMTYKFPQTLNKKIIIACQKVVIKDEDIPEVVVKETDDPQEADTIFGIYGVGKFKTREVQGHVCAIGANVCPIALKKNNIRVSEVPVTCTEHQIKRFSAGIKCNNCPKKTQEKLPMARCTGGLNGLPKSVMLINTSTDGLYYVAKQLKELGEDWYIASIVADPKKIEEQKKQRSSIVAGNSSKSSIKNKTLINLSSCFKGKNLKQSGKKVSS